MDACGNLFIPDSFNYRVRKVSTSGVITTVAGNGNYGYSGDGGAATNATLNFPWGVAVDAWGNLFIADHQNNRIREVSTNGIITTVVGGGQYYGGPATNVSLSGPQGLAIDASGNCFFAEEGNSLIGKLSTNGFVTLVTGDGIGGFSGDGGPATYATVYLPNDVALDTSGDLFIADTENGRIREVSTNGIITTVAGNGIWAFSGDGGSATNASLYLPSSVALDASGNLFIADTDNNRIRMVNTNGIITTMAGTGYQPGGFFGDGGPATNALLYVPNGVAVDTSGNLFISDGGNQRIRKVTNTQGPTLALNDVTAADVGNYQVVVTGPGISATSSVANLIVATSPLIYNTVANSDGSLALSFVSQPGSTNVVLCTTNLSAPVLWQPLGTNIAGANGDWQFTDTNTPSYQSRFYRSLMQ